MKLLNQYPEGLVLIGFKFHPENGVEGSTPIPVCLVTQNLETGEIQRIWQDDLMQLKQAPFPTGVGSLVVAYCASTEVSCFLALGWPLPVNLIDLFAEFRNLTNGKDVRHGNGLVGAMMHFGLITRSAEEKECMRVLILSTGPWAENEKQSILDYCASYIQSLAKLLPAMDAFLDLPRALLRGEYMKAVAQIEYLGTPIDYHLYNKIVAQWDAIHGRLIAAVDKDFGVFNGHTLITKRWENYLSEHGMSWLRLPSGELDMSDDAFKAMSHSYPKINPIRELRNTQSKLRLNKLTIGWDGRNRCLISAFRSKTGRNQPSNSKFIFGPATWLRGLIKPELGHALAYIDWSQQEFGIAAALSGDEKMIAAYRSVDPYLAFAIQAGEVPAHATKHSHPYERDLFKSTVLAVQYGMTAKSLAQRLNHSEAKAQHLLNLHRKTFHTFWSWSDACVDEAVLGGKLWTRFGWEMRFEQELNERSIRNWPMQANGAEMLRIACILINQADIQIIAPIHDAVLIQAPINQIGEAVITAQACMKESSRIVLDGFCLNSDVKVVKFPERYMDPRGVETWNLIMELIDEPKYK